MFVNLHTLLPHRLKISQNRHRAPILSLTYSLYMHFFYLPSTHFTICPTNVTLRFLPELLPPSFPPLLAPPDNTTLPQLTPSLPYFPSLIFPTPPALITATSPSSPGSLFTLLLISSLISPHFPNCTYFLFPHFPSLLLHLFLSFPLTSFPVLPIPGFLITSPTLSPPISLHFSYLISTLFF